MSKTDRDTVYAAIAGEMEFLEADYKRHCAEEGIQHIPFFNWRAEDFICAVYAAAQGLSCIQESYRLHAMRECAAWAMLAIQHCGCCSRNPLTGDPGGFIEAPLTMGQTQAMVNSERAYQDNLGTDRTDGRGHGSSGYIVMFRHYLTQVIERWTTHPGDEYALDSLRKIAGIGVHCLEDCGVEFRDPSNM